MSEYLTDQPQLPEAALPTSEHQELTLPTFLLNLDRWLSDQTPVQADSDLTSLTSKNWGDLLLYHYVAPSVPEIQLYFEENQPQFSQLNPEFLEQITPDHFLVVVQQLLDTLPNLEDAKKLDATTKQLLVNSLSILVWSLESWFQRLNQTSPGVIAKSTLVARSTVSLHQYVEEIHGGNYNTLSMFIDEMYLDVNQGSIDSFRLQQLTNEEREFINVEHFSTYKKLMKTGTLSVNDRIPFSLPVFEFPKLLKVAEMLSEMTNKLLIVWAEQFPGNDILEVFSSAKSLELIETATELMSLQRQAFYQIMKKGVFPPAFFQHILRQFTVTLDESPKQSFFAVLEEQGLEIVGENQLLISNIVNHYLQKLDGLPDFLAHDFLASLASNDTYKLLSSVMERVEQNFLAEPQVVYVERVSYLLEIMDELSLLPSMPLATKIEIAERVASRINMSDFHQPPSGANSGAYRFMEQLIGNGHPLSSINFGYHYPDLPDSHKQLLIRTTRATENNNNLLAILQRVVAENNLEDNQDLQGPIGAYVHLVLEFAGLARTHDATITLYNRSFRPAPGQKLVTNPGEGTTGGLTEDISSDLSEQTISPALTHLPTLADLTTHRQPPPWVIDLKQLATKAKQQTVKSKVQLNDVIF